MLTRRTRVNLIKTADENFNNLKGDLFNEEVIDAAIRIHSILNITANKYSNDAIIELIPEFTALLNKLDASLRVNEDLQKYLTDLSAEIQVLKSSVEHEKEKRRADFEESLWSEEKAENEITKLKGKIQSMVDDEIKLREELKNKKCIINLLESDCGKLTSTIERQGSELTLLRENKITEGDFRRTNSTMKYTKLKNYERSIETQNRFLPLTNKSLSPSQPAFKSIKVTADVHNTSRFSSLNPHTANKPTQIQRAPLKVNKCFRHKKKRKVIVLSDSQGRHLHSYLQDLDDKFEIYVSSKPGAKLKTIIEEGRPLIRSLNKDDFLIVLAGSNDFGPGDVGTFTVMQALQTLLNEDIDTNIIFHSIPYRYDKPEFDADISYTNQMTIKMILNHKGKQQLMHAELNAYLKRRHFTRHGLHYNKSGKRLLGKAIIEMITQLNSHGTTDDGSQNAPSSTQPLARTRAGKKLNLNTSAIEPCPDDGSPSETSATLSQSHSSSPSYEVHSTLQPTPPEAATYSTDCRQLPDADILACQCRLQSPPPPHLNSLKDFPPLTPTSLYLDKSRNEFHSTPEHLDFNSAFLDSSQL